MWVWWEDCLLPDGREQKQNRINEVSSSCVSRVLLSHSLTWSKKISAEKISWALIWCKRLCMEDTKKHHNCILNPNTLLTPKNEYQARKKKFQGKNIEWCQGSTQRIYMSWKRASTESYRALPWQRCNYKLSRMWKLALQSTGQVEDKGVSWPKWEIWEEVHVQVMGSRPPGVGKHRERAGGVGCRQISEDLHY